MGDQYSDRNCYATTWLHLLGQGKWEYLLEHFLRTEGSAMNIRSHIRLITRIEVI